MVDLKLKANLNQMQRLGDIINEVSELEANPVSPSNKFEGRQGYDANFLEGWKIDLPLGVGTKKNDMLYLKDKSGVELKYMHFSIVMSKSRKMAMITAANIDGSQYVSIGRSDKWYLDGRIREDQQWGNELYLDNRIDRGHMVRREDPVWGEHASTANLDTFHYTNSCPQMDVVNQQTWVGLENYILKNAKVHKMRVNVYTGPFFNHNDMEYRGARIPGAFWKVVAIVTENGRPSATAYKISQEKELTELETVYGPYLTYQISILQVMEDTGIDFSELVDYDGYSQEELETGSRFKIPIRELNEIRL